jgi:hypothetical protein
MGARETNLCVLVVVVGVVVGVVVVVVHAVPKAVIKVLVHHEKARQVHNRGRATLQRLHLELHHVAGHIAQRHLEAHVFAGLWAQDGKHAGRHSLVLRLREDAHAARAALRQHEVAQRQRVFWGALHVKR